VAKLRIPVGMLTALAGLAVGLQAELLRFQDLADDATADLMPKVRQFVRQSPQALTGTPFRVFLGLGKTGLKQEIP
jgi:hypothetical protein